MKGILQIIKSPISAIYNHLKLCSARKLCENRSIIDEERMDALENQLKEAKFMASEADKKFDEVCRAVSILGCNYNLVPSSIYCNFLFIQRGLPGPVHSTQAPNFIAIC